MHKTDALVILTPGFPASEADTACLPERQALVQSLHQSAPGLNIIVLSFEYPPESSSYLWHGIRVICFNRPKKGKLKKLLVWMKIWRKLNTIKKEHNLIALVSFWLGECAWISKYFSAKNNIKEFICLLGQDARPGNKYVKRVRPAPKKLIAVSDFIAAEFSKNYGISPQYVIPVGIDPSFYTHVASERTIHIMGAGSLIALKRYSIFIEVIASLITSFPNLRAVLCGKGPEKMPLLQKVHTLGLEKHITLLDEVPHPAVLELVQQTKVFLHPSSYEGFSTVCAEALCAGAHVVSFCKPMKKDIEHWHIVTTNQEMIEKVAEILSDPSIDHSPVVPYSLQQVTTALLDLVR